MRWRRLVSMFSSVGLAVTLAACSSGGNGDPAAMGTGGTGIDTGDAYTISPASLTFEARGGGLRPAAQSVQITALNAAVYLKTEISGAAVESARVDVTGERTAVVTVQPASPVDLPIGTSMASVRIIGCGDPVCSSQVAGSPKTVAITYTKSVAGLTGMPNSLTFTQTPGGPAPPGQSVSLRDLGGASNAWSSSISYQNASGWLAVTPASGTALPATAMVGIVPGATTATSHASLQFVVGTTSLFTVDVTYMLSADFRVMPSTMNVVGTFGAATPDQHLSLTDGLNESYAWTVQLEYSSGDLSGWATVSPTSGASLPADVVLSFGSLPDRLTHTAVLRVTAAGSERFVPLNYRTP